ncbi:MAG: MarR family transcriptional regulator [Ruminococcus sp.]|nr:MarR family transcriptional regulator [Ruminococcus sp.]
MTTREEALSVIQRLYGKPSNEVFKKLSNDNAGIHCMLKYLSIVGKPVSAGEISEFMQVSTARVSVLLRKMLDRGFIVREKSAEDARKIMISLSDRGRQEDRRHIEEMIGIFQKVIDEVGSERMEEFISVAHKIREIVRSETGNPDEY